MSKAENPPAFPAQGFKCADGVSYIGGSGMTLRDYFAIHATDIDLMPYIEIGNSRSNARYQFADAMLAERLK